jgi:hypothetical protein
VPRWTRGPWLRGCADTRHRHCRWRTADSGSCERFMSSVSARATPTS